MTAKEGCLGAYIILFIGWMIGYGTAYFVPPKNDNEPMVVEEQTSTETTVTTTESTTSSTITDTTITDVTTEPATTVTDITDTMTYLGSFCANYYHGDYVPCYGGSGRMLVSCYEKDEWYKGSVASKFVFDNYGYEVNGKTMVYIEFPSFERLNGWYSVDDYNADSSIVDFYFADYSTCPWQNDGVVMCQVWI